MFLDQYIKGVMFTKPFDAPSYLTQLPAVRYLMEHESVPVDHPVTFLVGENGTGKSTLIEAIAVAYGFNPEGGSKNFQFATVEAHSDLWKHLTLAKGKLARDGFFFASGKLF